jgi:hypothetical protein
VLLIDAVGCPPLPAPAGSGPVLKDDRWGASYWMQFSILFVRAIRTRRFQSLSTQDFVQFIAVGACVSRSVDAQRLLKRLFSAHGTFEHLIAEAKGMCFHGKRDLWPCAEEGRPDR